ncbi:MAG: hypothetical protein JNN08_27635 [Bryobacterales bacterium]|nr:hypothetical protein [Bryobacterales bacterium]
MRTALYLIPRILAIGFGLFVILLALDSFSDDASIWEKLGGFGVLTR